jgi:site-specific DNA-methyltransferase (adenine-specific)
MKPYFENEWVQIHHGAWQDVLPKLGVVDHVITDPPYSEYTHKHHVEDRGRKFRDGGVRKAIDFEAITPESFRVFLDAARVRRWLVSTMDCMLAHDLERDPPDGWRFVRCGVWVKPGSVPQFSGDRPARGWEQIVVMHRDLAAGEGRMRWNGGGLPAVWVQTIEQGEHPTQKPIALYRKFIEQFTDPKDVILDPFMGSGTTLRAAMDTGRMAIGIEMIEEYCELAAKRMEQTAMPLYAVTEQGEQSGMEME